MRRTAGRQTPYTLFSILISSSLKASETNEALHVATRCTSPDALGTGRTKWHIETVEEVLKAHGSAAHGLSDEEAADRFRTYGPNEVPREKRRRNLYYLSKHLNEPVTCVPLASAAMSAYLQGCMDAVVISRLPRSCSRARCCGRHIPAQESSGCSLSEPRCDLAPGCHVHPGGRPSASMRQWAWCSTCPK